MMSYAISPQGGGSPNQSDGDFSHHNAVQAFPHRQHRFSVASVHDDRTLGNQSGPDGAKYFFFQYWVDSPGQEERQRRTEIVGAVGQITKSEAERKKLEFIANLKLNTDGYRIPSSRTFADAAKFYREVFAPRMLRASTFSVADGHIKHHLEHDWNEVPIEHIDIDAVNEWIWKKRQSGLSWVTVKNILRTMQRVLSCCSKDKKPPFSQEGLAIPDKDKLQMKIESRKAVSFSWFESNRIAEYARRAERLDETRRSQYAMLFVLASATGLRCGELFALRINDIDFEANTIRVDESVDRSYTVGRAKTRQRTARFCWPTTRGGNRCGC
jgi:integrase